MELFLHASPDSDLSFMYYHYHLGKGKRRLFKNSCCCLKCISGTPRLFWPCGEKHLVRCKKEILQDFIEVVNEHNYWQTNKNGLNLMSNKPSRCSHRQISTINEFTVLFNQSKMTHDRLQEGATSSWNITEWKEGCSLWPSISILHVNIHVHTDLDSFLRVETTQRQGGRSGTAHCDWWVIMCYHNTAWLTAAP